MPKSMLILLITSMFLSCSKEYIDPSHYVFLRHKGADMPLLVQGNKNSGVFIIYLHGGPGGSSFIDIQNRFFSEIENEYAMVYYDQRGSGNSIGKSKKELLTLDQFVEDLDVVVSYVQKTYQPSKIILLGHSWGGTLGTAYLLNSDYRSKISAWIEVDGGHNVGQAAFFASRDFVLRYAQEKITSGSDSEVKKWQKAIDYYQTINHWRNPKDLLKHAEFVTNAKGYFFDENKRKGLVGIRQTLSSETDFVALMAQNKFVVHNMDVWHYDFTSRLHEINLPTLLLWGIQDGILPVELAYQAKQAMGLDSINFYVFQQSAHSPHYEETALFNQKVKQFIKTL